MVVAGVARLYSDSHSVASVVANNRVIDGVLSLSMATLGLRTFSDD